MTTEMRMDLRPLGSVRRRKGGGALLVAGLLLGPVGCSADTAPGQPAPSAAASPTSPAVRDTADAPLVSPPLPEISVRRATPPPPAPAQAPPRFLRIEGTTIAVDVVDVGLGQGNAMEIPDSFNEAGWYRYGPAPGDAEGNSVIAAHVDTVSDLAPFSQLRSLLSGTRILVQQSDGTVLAYRVSEVANMDKDDFDGAGLFRRDGPHQLKLVTCGGEWLDERQDYSDNVVVTALPE